MLSVVPPPYEKTLEGRVEAFRDKYRTEFEIACKGLDEADIKLDIVPKIFKVSDHNGLPASVIVSHFFDNVTMETEPVNFERSIDRDPKSTLRISPKGRWDENSIIEFLGHVLAHHRIDQWDKSYKMAKIFEKFRADLKAASLNSMQMDTGGTPTSEKAEKIDAAYHAMNFIVENFPRDYTPLANDLYEMHEQRRAEAAAEERARKKVKKTSFTAYTENGGDDPSSMRKH